MEPTTDRSFAEVGARFAAWEEHRRRQARRADNLVEEITDIGQGARVALAGVLASLDLDHLTDSYHPTGDGGRCHRGEACAPCRAEYSGELSAPDRRGRTFFLHRGW